MKALEKYRNRRYETASAFAVDVERYLKDEPVLACPPSAWYRFRKFARRHEAAVCTALLVAGTLALTSAVLTGTNVRIQQETGRKEEALKLAQANAEEAKEQAWQAHEQQLRAESYLARALKLTEGRSGVVQALRSADRPAEAELAFRQILDFWESLLQDSPENLNYLVQVANQYWNLGDMLKFVGQPRKAVDPYRRAADGYAKLLPAGLLGGDDAIRNASNWGEIQLGMADMLRDSGQTEQAEKAYHDNFQIWERLQHDSPDGPWEWHLAQARTHLAVLLAGDGHREEAEGEFRQALALQEKLDQRSVGITLYCRGLAETQYALGGLLWDLGRSDQAEKAFVEARWKWHGAMRGEQVAWLLASCPHPKVRNPKEAIDAAKVFAERADVARRQPGATWQHLRSAGYNRRTLGVAYYRAGEAQAAVTALEEAMGLRRGGDASERFYLAMAHWKLDHPNEARKWYDQAVRWQEESQAHDDEVRRFRAEAAELLGIDKKN